MALFGTNTVFSRVEGVVVQNGAPVVGAEVNQYAALRGRVAVDRMVRTDADGRFSFDVVAVGKGLMELLPVEFTVAQDIKITHNGQDYVGYGKSKQSPEVGSEVGQPVIRLVCDLDAPHEYHEHFHGICRLVDK